MALTSDEKRRQRELENAGYRGSNNSELHGLNVKENSSKSSAELRKTVLEREARYGHGSARKARAALRNRGESA